jgi:hypothetical protein
VCCEVNKYIGILRKPLKWDLKKLGGYSVGDYLLQKRNIYANSEMHDLARKIPAIARSVIEGMYQSTRPGSAE